MDKLPIAYTPTRSLPYSIAPTGSRASPKLRFFWFCLSLLAFYALCARVFLLKDPVHSAYVPINASRIIDKCRKLDLLPGPPPNFHARKASDRFVPGTRPTLIRNATVWTGRVDGLEVIRGDVFMDRGMIRAVGEVDPGLLAEYDAGAVTTLDVNGAWVSPGADGKGVVRIIDVHSHLGVYSSPALKGSADWNSHGGPILPWLRSLDALNTHDDAFALTVAGGVTAALVLPGSANAIGGQAFTIKLRKTAERSPTSMLLEPPYDLNGTDADIPDHLRWRQMKHACGENPSRVYSNTRMDTFWAFRQAYDKARQIKEEQDAYCSKALTGQWADLGKFPEDLQWEALVDVLRGRVRVQAHCYEAVDFDDLIRITNEFKFSIAAVHHASEAYLVPDVLKRAYAHPPAVALFATHGRYKREAYRSSELAPRILTDSGLKVVMKSDHPVTNSRYLLFEAQQAHYYGLAGHVALSAVTTHAAQVLGMDHRIGYVKKGWDADLAIWDSHPLALGATPSQVFVDGIPQLAAPYVVHKPVEFQSSPKTPNFDRDAAKALEYDGLPPLLPTKADTDLVLFKNVRTIILPVEGRLTEVYIAQGGRAGIVLVKNGSISCYGEQSKCLIGDFDVTRAHVVDLRQGAITPGLLSYGAPLGLQEITQEASTGDGNVYDTMIGSVPNIVGKDTVMRAVDGLQFTGRSELLAYRAGVTQAISAPSHKEFLGGLGTSFSLGAFNKLERGAIIQEVTGLHVAVRHFGVPSVSTQIAALRRLLLSTDKTVWSHISQENMTLVVEADSADVIASLILLKGEVEDRFTAKMKMTIAGATEAHLLAKEIAQAGVGIILNPPRPFPAAWEHRRVLPGPPLSKESGISLLLAHNVTVGIGVVESSSAVNARFDAAWAALESAGRISKTEALALVSTNLEKLLGGKSYIDGMSDLVATEGGDLLGFESKVVAVISPRRVTVDLF
ncbi:hypothetical protein EW146_g1322 [Bondarzewia mesenterica]|uniref:Amidohydrolase-related domain-containing protein n=1 Tax=Bondarzewia mesenterica TaxID=1095465 RepID=A0A4S4M496_9AGAM|nr:hypothetical protein EW146_g1322 [Bondarzewia mesenterica]